MKFLLDLLSQQLNAVLSEEETKKFLYDSLQLFRLLSEELSQGFQLIDVVGLMGQTDVLRFTCAIVTKYLLRRECTVCELLKDQAIVFLVHFTVYDDPLPCQMLCHPKFGVLKMLRSVAENVQSNPVVQNYLWLLTNILCENNHELTCQVIAESGLFEFVNREAAGPPKAHIAKMVPFLAKTVFNNSTITQFDHYETYDSQIDDCCRLLGRAFSDARWQVESKEF